MTSYFKHLPRAPPALYPNWLKGRNWQEVTNRVTVQQGTAPVCVSFSSQEAQLGGTGEEIGQIE